MVKREKANYMIQSVSHALDVLEELAKAAGEVGVTELSKRLKLHKNNVFRLLATLELRGYVEQNRDTEDYRLGVKALQLGQSYLVQSKLVSRAAPILKGLAEQLGETVSLAVLQNGQVQFPLSFEARKAVKVSPRVAVSFTGKQNAAGRLLIAQLPDAVVNELLAGNSPQDAAVRSQLTELRNSGSIIDRGAIEADVVSICKVIRSYGNEVCGAIEILVPQYRAKVESILPIIDETAAALSTALGSLKLGMSTSLSSTLEKEISTTTSPSSMSGSVAGGASTHSTPGHSMNHSTGTHSTGTHSTGTHSTGTHSTGTKS